MGPPPGVHQVHHQTTGATTGGSHRGTPEVTEIQEGHGVQLTELTDTSNEISQRVNQVNKETVERRAVLTQRLGEQKDTKGAENCGHLEICIYLLLKLF